MVIMSKKQKPPIKPVDTLVHCYLDYVKSLGEELTCSEISEILRYSLCVAQGLETKGYSERVEALGVGATTVLKGVLTQENLDNISADMKRGLLEACVLSIESARNRVLEVCSI